ncbi:uncharacterized protein LOC133522343 [Cydia pomonella]|uniref:uncharacterized protein LOC133522343 n=1 Tax=Cydia pomonella TaxID=82600 RepID=UPI002ADD4ACA|nr:uncharacterized protein LOC133522343 [Cydia pomonella]
MRALSIVVLFALATMAAAGAPTLYDLNKVDSLFEKFIQDHKREYKDAADRELHFNAFKQNVAKINEHNSKGSSATYGINKFADYTDEEKQAMRGFKRN